jgi:hypothetical protein
MRRSTVAPRRCNAALRCVSDVIRRSASATSARFFRLPIQGFRLAPAEQTARARIASCLAPGERRKERGEGKNPSEVHRFTFSPIASAAPLIEQLAPFSRELCDDALELESAGITGALA